MPRNRNSRSAERGQVLAMVSISLVAMIALVGLVTDVGWTRYIQSSAQKAADSAAMAAATQVLDTLGQTPYTCGANVICQAVTQCPGSIPNPPDNAIQAGCLYAQQNGFRVGGKGGRQNVTMSSDVTAPPPTAPGVNDVTYWVTTRVNETVPQLFSAVLGNSMGNASARATAVITSGILSGTLFLLNRQNDNSPFGRGVNVSNGGNPTINAEGGILMASTAHGDDGQYAGKLQGTAAVISPYTRIRGAGTVSLGGNASWTAAAQDGFGDSAYFKDPEGGKPQPPAPLGLVDRPIAGGQIVGSNDPLNPLVLQPGNYFATSVVKGGTVASGAPISVTGYVTFSDGGAGFGNYVFFGGLQFPNSNTTATFAAGRYFVAGVNGNPGEIFSAHTQVTLQDYGTAGQRNSDAGEIFVFTDTGYPGLQVPALVQPIASTLKQGTVSLQAGNSNLNLNLHGLNRTSPQLPAELKDYAPVVFWQDQRNSLIKYDSNGNVDYTSCGGDHSLDNPCPNSSLANSNSPGMNLQATPGNSLYGVVYQPRGAWVTLQGNGNINAPVVFITGSFNAQGGADLRMLDPRDALKRRAVMLVE